jgi:hypothetical protein
MRWRPLSYFALLSAAPLLVILMMWASSHEDQRDVKFGPLVSVGGTSFFGANLQSHRGGVWLQTLSASSATGATSRTHVNLLGVAVTSGDVLVGSPASYVHSIAVRVPYWFFAGVAAVLPLLWVRERRRQQRRFHAGHCPRCGFDLRITPDSCPECGLLIVRDTAGDNDESQASFNHLHRAPL